MVPRFFARNGWSVWHGVGALVLMAVAALLTRHAWADILRIATDREESSHIFLVPVVFAWLVWVRRERLRYCYPIGQALGPIMIAVGWLISWYGYYNAVLAFWHAGAVAIVLGALFSVVGADVLRRFLPAFVVLGFLVPVPGVIRQQVALPLQGQLATLTQQIFGLAGVAVERSGNMLTINGHDVAIAEACNGMRMVFALVLVSYAFAFGTPLRGYVRFVILAATPISALGCNVLRMIPTVWLYGRKDQPLLGVSGERVAETFHDAAGWIMLVVAFLLLMGIIKMLRWALLPVTPYTLAYD